MMENGQAYCVVLEYQMFFPHWGRIQGERIVYGPWGTKAAATRVRNELKNDWLRYEKQDWRNKLYTLQIKRASSWVEV